jgi:glutathione S-transferase
MALTFYHVNWCPECAVVREKLAELGLDYEDVVVPDVRMFRKQVYEVSGQYYVPVLKDDDLVLTETRDILNYLDETYGPDSKGQAARPPEASGGWARGKGKASRTGQGTVSEPRQEGDDYPSCRL